LVQFFITLQLTVVAIALGQLTPELVDDFKSFGPAHVAVAADHVRGNEDAVGSQGRSDIREQSLESDNVMKRLIGDDCVVTSLRLPGVEVALGEREIARNSRLFSEGSAAFEHGWREVEALDGEILKRWLRSAAVSITSMSQLPEPMLMNRFGASGTRAHWRVSCFMKRSSGLQKPNASHRGRR
jgi:hypothetical protein